MSPHVKDVRGCSIYADLVAIQGEWIESGVRFPPQPPLSRPLLSGLNTGYAGRFTEFLLPLDRKRMESTGSGLRFIRRVIRPKDW